LSRTLTAILLLACSNVFMTFAWYAHLKELNSKAWFIAALVSWGIALSRAAVQPPALGACFPLPGLGRALEIPVPPTNIDGVWLRAWGPRP
jgi:uncharacterized protein